MKQRSGYLPVQAQVPFRGLATSFPPNRIQPEWSPDLLNVTIRDGTVRRRAGYMKLGQTLDGVILGLTEFAKIGSSDVMVVFTSLAQYYYKVDTNEFIDISIEEVDTYNITGVTTGDPSFLTANNMSTDPDMVSGTKFIVTGSTANDGVYTCSGNPTLTITTVETMPDDTIDGVISATSRHQIASNNATTFTLAAGLGDVSSDYPAGKIVYCKDSTGADGTYKVVSAANSPTDVVVVETIPDLSGDGYLTRRDNRTYTEGDIINFEPAVDINSKRLLMTNGVDSPIQWFGDTADEDGHFLRWVPLFANFVTCKTFRVFKEHLILGDVTGAASEPQLAAWSDSGDFEDFENGNSGSQLLYELTTGIQQLVNLGDRLIIYSNDAIASGIFIGGTFIFAFEVIIPEGVRLASSKGIVSINVGHIYASEENFYLFDGTRGLRSLSDIIRTDYKALKDQNTIYKMAAINDYSKKTIFIAFPTQDNLGIIYTMEYDAFDLSKRVWSKERYSDIPRAFGFFVNTIAYLWDDTKAELVLAAALGQSFLHWGDEVGTWANEGQQLNFPVRIFGDASGTVYLINEGVLSDNGVNSPGFFETGEFTVPEEFLSTFGRWVELEFEAKGETVKITVVHEETSTVVDEALTLDGNVDTYRIKFDVSARALRVRFDFDEYFELTWVKVWVRPGSQR